METIRQAILAGDLSRLKELTGQNSRLIQGTTDEGLPLAFLAAQTGCLPIVQYLL